MFHAKNLKSSEENEREYNRFFEEHFNITPSVNIKKTWSWYLWAPKDTSVISGPYFTTNGVDAGNNSLCKNRWQYWVLEDGKKKDQYFKDDYDGIKFRYMIGFRVEDSNTSYLRYVGIYKDKLILWTPIIDSYDGVSLKYSDTIQYYKVSKEELNQMVHEEYGK